ncbi:MAG: FAD-binding protein [Saprospiraceae bacterium]|nr:FAD-binding protein [Saprospiraceae bacterium]
MIGDAVIRNNTIKAVGGSWALSPIAYDRQTIIETDHLNLRWTPIEQDVNNAIFSRPDNLVFAQCGTQIKSLNIYLRDRKKSLKAHGASNGQGVAGAIACGTHGAAYDFGSIHDSVVGLHIIVNKDKSYYIQKKSRQVINETFATNINSTIINDDDLFNAAVVSMGCFGFVHGVMIEVEDWFMLKNYSLTSHKIRPKN